jgi:hypothetical protein
MSKQQVYNSKMLPQEIWDKVVPYISPAELYRSACVLRYKLTKNQEAHNKVWKTIFKSPKWLEIVTKLKINPVLISPELNQHYALEDIARPTYIVLATWDTNGNLPKYKQDFFDSLQDKYTYDVTREEVTFSSGITLNVHNALLAEETVPVDITRLFRGKRPAKLSTYYLSWDDSAYSVRKAERGDFLGPHMMDGTRGAVLKPSNPAFFCEMRLKAHEHSVWLRQRD